MKKECFAAFDQTLGGFRRSEDIFNQPFYFDHSSRLHSKYAKFHPSYIKFVEDAMLVLFLLCVLVTLLVVHRGSCYRQIRSARRNGPLRYIIPHPDDLPPPYSNYGPAVANGGQGSEGTRNSAPGMKNYSKKLFLTSAWCLKITQKVSLNIASEASYVYILSGQKLI